MMKINTRDYYSKYQILAAVCTKFKKKDKIQCKKIKIFFPSFITKTLLRETERKSTAEYSMYVCRDNS